MEVLLEILVQFVGEVLLQVVFEVLAEAGLRVFQEPFRKPPNPWLAAVGYGVMGAILGAISLLILPGLLMASREVQITNLILTPLVAGAVMAAIGAWRRRRHQELIRLDRFAYGYLFALAMALVRFSFGD